MNYLGKFIDNFRHAYKEINAATLTGAIDVIVVQQPNGTYTCSPFHVRFGKIGVLRSREKIVEIEINGEPCNIFMKLGESGEAFFVEELIEEEGIPAYMVCSPIPCSESQSDNSQDKSQDWTNERNEDQTDGLEDKTLPKTFHAKTVEEGSTKADFRPIRSVSDSESGLGYMRDDLSRTKKLDGFEEIKSAPSSTKRRRRRKMMAKRKLELESRKNNSENLDHTILNSESVSQEDTDINQTEDTLEDEDMKLEVVLSSQSVPSIPSDLHFFSDTEVTVSSNTRQHSPVQSDTEFEITRQTENKDDSVLTDGCLPPGSIEHQSWRWGELPTPIPKSESSEVPLDSTKSNDDAQRSTLASMLGFMKRTKHMRQKSADGGIYLSELMVHDLDQDTVKKYLPYFGEAEINRNTSTKNKDDDIESGNGTSLAQSPTSEVESLNEGVRDADENSRIENRLNVAMSLCGGLAGTGDVFDQHIIRYEEFLNDPGIFKNPNVMFRIDDEICTWEKACPIILSHAAYNKPLPQEIRHRLGSNDSKEKENGSLNQDVSEKTRYRRGYSSWFTWARSNRNKSQGDPTPQTSNEQTESAKLVETASLDNATTSEPTPELVVLVEGEETGIKEPSVERKMRTYSSTDSESETYVDGISSKEKCRKSLRLSSEQIASLNLREGSNEVAFSVTTAYQGTTRCKCTLFLWRYDDKIVISDIDGTITKSDVLGHLLPIVGNDWAQSGVVKLFNRIKDNGYKLLYLSARAIGQSKGTRRYLNSIRQEDLTLPEGPLLLNPTSLLSAFHREVIEKKPEEFKISCLRDIQALFPNDPNPFYAGYGNKINDVWAYQAVGIPLFRIFTINHKGELKHELTETFQSTYLNMSQIADQMFPIRCEDNTTDGNYSQFVYWRDPIPDLDLVA